MYSIINQIKLKIMGYTTDFSGCLKLSIPLRDEQKNYLVEFSETRRMKRDVNKLMELHKGKYGYPGRIGTPENIYGVDGEYFVGGGGSYGQDNNSSVIDYNTPPGQIGYSESTSFGENIRKITYGECQPSLWCQWVVCGENNDILEWDGGEKFYKYVEWLRYLINHFFQPWGVMLNGVITWYGEDRNDFGKIVVEDNDVRVLIGQISFSEI